MTSPNNSPVATCIIAVCNGEAYLHEAIDSLLAQSYPHVEIVVVDDGSTDGTPEVIARYGNRIRSLRQENLGVSTARNRGVAISTGQYLCFLDADDIYEPRKMALQAAALEGDPSLDLCDCFSSFFWTPEMPIEQREKDLRHDDPFWQNSLAAHISSWFFRRALWDRVGGFAPQLRYAEDQDWLSRARDLPIRRHTLPDVLSFRRMHTSNVTLRHRAVQDSDMADMLKSHLLRVRARGRN
jgi:glycosyltransferase involved in cell wall biosynthesis